MRVIKRTIKKGQEYYECGRDENVFEVLKVSRRTGRAITSNRFRTSSVRLSRLADTRYYKLID